MDTSSLHRRTNLCQDGFMTGPEARTSRRTDALSRERIVTAAIELLDDGGEHALTVRALSSHLLTGRGALYHHVSGMDELLAAAADHVVEGATEQAATGADPQWQLRAFAVGLFDAIGTHPWVGTQLSRDPLQPAVFRLWKSIAVQLQRLGVNGRARADAGGALTNYILGSAAQYGAGARRVPDRAARQSYLDDLAAAWSEQDSDSVVAEAVLQLREHDDRDQFLAGIDIFLTGIRGR